MSGLFVAVGCAALAAASVYAAAVFPAAAANAGTAKVPDFIADDTTGWTLLTGRYGGKDYQPVPKGMPVPDGFIGDDPAHPHFGNTSGKAPTLRLGDANSPILLPWAQEEMKRTNAAILAGGVPYDPAARCWPAGVPAAVTFAVEPLYFIAAPGEVIMLYQRGQVARHVYLDRPHSAHVDPSWYGESVGHYEGDSFIVDTIGLSDQSFVDDFNTPHTNALHVIERYRLVDAPDGKNGKVLQAIMTMEDPGAFTKPWSAMKLLGPTKRPVEESLCQIHNDDVFNQGLRPVPTAAKPDF